MSRKQKGKSDRRSSSDKRGGQRRSVTGPSSAPRGRYTIWIYRLLLALVAPILLLVGLEFGLRMSGYGFSTDFFIASEDGKAWVENPKFAWQFYSPSSRLKPHPFRLSQAKSEDSIRIFVLGGSAALGTPESAYGFVRILERMLELSFPDQTFEVINAAMPGINSHLVRSIARDCARREPDLFLVYMGNNELVGLHAPGPDSQGLTDKLPILRLIQAVRSSRTGQLLGPLTQALAPKQPEGEQDMAFFREHRLSSRDPGRRAVYRNLYVNLYDILNAARSAGAKTVVSTVAVNLRECPPLGSLHDPKMDKTKRAEWDSQFALGISHQDGGDYEAALLAFEAAWRLDHGYAELAYRLAQCHEALGNVDQASGYYYMARDLDALPFRADSGVIQAIREVTQQFASDGVRLLKADQLLTEDLDTAVALPGLETFYEHVHFRFAGDYRLASLFFREVQTSLQEKLGLEEGALKEPPSLDECALALAYNRVNEGLLESSIMDLTSHAPFLDQIGHEQRKEEQQARLRERYGNLNTEDVAEAFRIYQEAKETYPNDWNLPYLLARLHFTFHNFEAARDNLALATKLMPHVLEVQLGYTRALIETKQFDDAFREIKRMQESHPGSPEVEAALSTAKARQAAGR